MMPASIAARGEAESFADETARLRRAAAAAVARTPGLFAAVLYGSRARGDHRPDSDWDIAFVAADERRGDVAAAARELGGALPGLKVSVLPLAARELRRKANALGNVASAIVREGKLIAGAWDRPEARGAPTMEEEEYRVYVRRAAARITRAALALAELPGPLGEGNDEDVCDFAISDSADGAEMLVKAMLGRIVGTFPRTHNLNELGGLFAPARPGLRDAVRELNGGSAADHVAGYAVFLDPKAVRRACARLAGAARLLAGELREAADAGALKNVATGLAGPAAAQFAGAAEALRKAEAAPGAATESTAVEAAIAQRGAMAAALEAATAELRALAPRGGANPLATGAARE